MKKTLLFLICLVFVIKMGKAQEGAIPDSVEYQALVELYHATGGDAWFNNAGWLQDPDFSTWYGITVENGDITAIDLAFNDLTGRLPSGIGQLKKLKELWLDFNFLEGEIPDEIGELTDLEMLVLSINYLGGQIPASLTNLQNLEVFSIGGNAFDGSFPEILLGLASLKELHIGLNSFSGTIPDGIGQLSNLEILNLADNLFEGGLPNSICNLQGLVDIILDYNFFSGTLPQCFGDMQQLEYFSIGDNTFEGTVPDGIADRDLYGFYAKNNNLIGVPDFTRNPNSMYIVINVQGNKLEFDSLEPYFDLSGNLIYHGLDHYPQDSVHTYFSSATNTFSVEVGGNFNQYQWLKNGQTMAGETAPALVRPQTPSDGDVYQCRISNTRVKDLVLHSKAVPYTAGEFWAVKDGNWKDIVWGRERNGTLIKAFPVAGSTVFINSHHIILTDNLECGPVEVIVEDSAASLTVDGSELTIHGTLTLEKLREGYPGNIKVINNGKIIPVE